jgi:hypothetical protein
MEVRDQINEVMPNQPVERTGFARRGKNVRSPVTLARGNYARCIAV